MEKGDDGSSVRVALRIRPQNGREKIDVCQMCTHVTPGEPQVFLGKDKAFTYDNVFDIDSTQEMLYNMCARSLIEGCLEGYNATIFAYGQTGAGKTYSMGTGFDVNASPEEIGIIPRAVDHLFQGIEARRNKANERNETPPDFKVTAQFMELYNEEIIDLLDTTRDPSERNKKSHIKIHEDAGGGIYTVGVTTRPVSSMQDTMHCLKVGALCRTTASTNMNSQSSRSHAIFTLHVKQQRVVPAEPEGEGEEVEEEEEAMVQRDSSPQLCEFEMLTAKFHFVDLAGSERLKRTGATGDRAKEGISINCGLLALGNVISALGDKMKRGCHVPYRDSKLTRLLQDSLGGNSRTVMIACVSPCDRDFMETLNTLKYANRARNIQNKVTVNQDKTSKQIAAMRIEIKLLQEELLDYKQGRRVVDGDGVETINDMFHENTMLQTENNNLRKRIRAMQETIENLNAKNVQLLSEQVLQNITNISGDASQDEISKLIQGYIQEIEELRSKLVESEALCETLRKQSARSPSSRSTSSMGLSTPMQTIGGFSGYDVSASHEDQVEDILELAKKDVKKLKKTFSRQSSKTKSHGSIKEEPSDNDKDINEAEDDENAESQEKSDEDVSDEEMEGDQEENEADLGEESSEDSDIEDQDSDNIHEDLAELTCEISIKQKLIEELEVSQKRLQTLRHQYEEKLNLLQAKIKDTEVERDTVLTNLGKVETSSGDQMKKVKSQYQKKIDEMQGEVKKLQAAKKEHSKLLRNQAHYEKQLKTLQHDLTEMKKTKVRLMCQIKEEAKRNKISESRTHKEIAQLKKDQRQREVQIKNLESAKRQKEIILKRKQEEVEQLRKRPVKNMSARVAGRTGRYNYPLPVTNNKQPASTITYNNNNNMIKPPSRVQRRRSNREFSSKAAKQKWDAVEKSVNGIVTRKQTVSHMEKDMNTWLKEREKLAKKVEKLSRKRQEAVIDEKEEQFLVALDFEIENLHSRLEQAQDNISECQSNIMELMEIKDEDAMAMINTCTLDEARYLLEHLLGFAITKGMAAAQKDTETKELTVKLGKVKRHNSFHYSLLQYVMHHSNTSIEIEDEWLNRPVDEVSESDSDSSGSETSGYNRYLDSFLPENTSTPNILEVKKKKEKARRKTATTEDLLYAGMNPSEGMKPLLPLAEREDTGSPSSPPASSPVRLENDDKLADPLEVPKQSLSLPKDPMAVPKGTKHGGILGLRESLEKFTQELSVPKQQVPNVADSALMPPPKGLPLTRANPSHVTTDTVNGRPEPSPAMRRKVYNNRPTPEPSPQMRRRNGNAMSRQNSLDRGSDAEGPTPPGSPTATRRSSLTNPTESNDVFSRLTGSRSSSPSNCGSINPNTKLQSSKSCPLVCTHKAEGHTKAVLSVCATDDLLFSSSKDRSAKVWDLNTGQEIATLAGHPNNVTCVKYCEASHIAFTVSTYFTKLWDIRDHNKCVKTLCSSGQCTKGPLATAASSARHVGLPLGEMMINDIAHNRQGTMLFSAAGNLVRLWDLRRFQPVGKLSGGHQAAIMTLTVEEDEQVTVVTGSKDHYIKVFQMPQSAIGVLTPKYNLEPPHYDGIQCLAMTGNILFSGSRDNCIKKWDLAEQQLKQSLNSAHKDWVCGLAFMPGGNCLLSSCRGGYLKLWHVDSCMLIGEIKGHTSPINAITTNSTSVFTASNDLTVGIWRARSIDNSDSCQSDNDERDRLNLL